MQAGLAPEQAQRFAEAMTNSLRQPMEIEARHGHLPRALEGHMRPE